jgi:hypothetical protein
MTKSNCERKTGRKPERKEKRTLSYSIIYDGYRGAQTVSGMETLKLKPPRGKGERGRKKDQGRKT